MFFLFDVGGTKTRMVMSNGEEIPEPYIVPTPANPDSAVDLFREFVKDNKIDAACGGLPGNIDYALGCLFGAKNLPEWGEYPMRDRLYELFGCPIYIENDAVLAGLGEASFGAGIGYDIVAYITISTGIGGTRIVHGKKDIGKLGFEPGKHTIDVDATIHNPFVTFEDLVSGHGLEQRYGAKPEDISDENIWREFERLVAIGLQNVTLFWSPEVIVLGGGVMKSPHLTLHNIEKELSYLSEKYDRYPGVPVIKKYELGDKSGLYGALAVIKNH